MLQTVLTVWEHGQVTFDVVRGDKARRSVLWFGLYVPLSSCVINASSKVVLELIYSYCLHVCTVHQQY